MQRGAPPQVLRAPSERPAPRAGPRVCPGPAQQRPRGQGAARSAGCAPSCRPAPLGELHEARPTVGNRFRLESRKSKPSTPPAPLEELDPARPLAADTRNRPPCRARETESKGRLRVDESKLSQLKMKVSARRARLPWPCPSTRRISGLPTLIFSPAAPPKQGGK